MFGEVVAGVGAHVFEHALTRRKAEQGVKLDTGLTGDDLRGLCTEFKRLYAEGSGTEFPQDPREQLRLAISAVFRSWGAPRAHVYRRANDISDDLGTAANICQMVFGNRGEGSGTGVCFSRDPATGEHVLYGEFLAERPGRGRRRRHPHARADRAHARAAARGLRRARGDGRAPRAASPRGAGHRVHGRAGPPLHAADAHRQAHGAGRAADRARVRGRGRDHAGRGRAADRPGAARPAAAPAPGHVRRGRADRARAGRLARRGGRRRRLRRRHRRQRAAPPARPSCSCAGRRRPTTSTA